MAAPTIREISMQISEGLEATRELIHALELKQAQIVSELAALRTEVRELLSIVRDGDGSKPLVIRVNNLEMGQEALKDLVAQMRTAVDAIRSGSVVTAAEDARGRWLVVSALLSGLLGLAGSIAAWVLK